MTSSNVMVSPRRRNYIRLIGEVRHALRQALSEENHKNGLNQNKIAAELSLSKSAVSRKFAGTSNMTFESLADLAFAMNRPVRISIPERVAFAGSNSRPAEAKPTIAAQGDLVATTS